MPFEMKGYHHDLTFRTQVTTRISGCTRTRWVSLMLQDQFAAERSRLVLLTLSARAYATRTLAKEGLALLSECFSFLECCDSLSWLEQSLGSISLQFVSYVILERGL
jgi:hypothetical protein